MIASPKALRERVAVAAGPLAPLAASLAADLDRSLPDEDVFIPEEKARLTRVGGRCMRDGASLEFDPASPRRHRCAVCGTEYEGDDHDRWWVMGYQLWLVERAVHAAVLWRLAGASRHHDLARAILSRLSERYLAYPNADNVLGPSRVFFSTYLESIWLLHIAVATWLLERDGTSHTGQSVRDRIIEPASAIIAPFNEGMSNRQVWNAAALGASASLLERDVLLERAVHGPGGLTALLSNALLDDGTWYEGENYHLFAHRGLWYLVRLAEEAGATLAPALVERFDRGFAAPLRTALPDFTFPARRDAQYGASLRQWRVAESLELGLARATEAAELAGGLARLYDETVPAGDTTRWRSTAEAERNVPAVRLTRADLGWKSLLFALPEVPAAQPTPPASVLMEGQGLGVIRRDDGRTFVALDYGHSGGGHGHPDRLNLWLLVDGTRVFEDVGTGSYVDPTLHWYRSTLAHNAPLVDGRSQDRVDGVLRAWDDRDHATWIDAEAAIAPGVLVRRSVVVAGSHLVDRVQWRADRSVEVDVPMHLVGDVQPARWEPAALTGGRDPEDGFAFATRSETAGSISPAVVSAPGTHGIVCIDGTHAWWRAVAPGPPRHPARPFLLARMTGSSGAMTAVWSLGGALDATVDADGARCDVVEEAGTWRHRVDGETWHITTPAGATLQLDGRRSRPAERVAAGQQETRSPLHVPVVASDDVALNDLAASGAGLRRVLGEAHYRRTEATWHEAGRPTAAVSFAATDRDLVIEVAVPDPDPHFAPRRDANPLDNEHPDTNSDGVQVHLATAAGDAPRYASWLLVPEPPGPAVRCTGSGDAAAIPLDATWCLTSDGWRLTARIPRTSLDPPPVVCTIDVIVNEMPAGRERRRGQLVLSGRGSGWAWLRGNRQDRDVLLPVRLDDA